MNQREVWSCAWIDTGLKGFIGVGHLLQNCIPGCNFFYKLDNLEYIYLYNGFVWHTVFENGTLLYSLSITLVLFYCSLTLNSALDFKFILFALLNYFNRRIDNMLRKTFPSVEISLLNTRQTIKNSRNSWLNFLLVSGNVRFITNPLPKIPVNSFVIYWIVLTLFL